MQTGKQGKLCLDRVARGEAIIKNLIVENDPVWEFMGLVRKIVADQRMQHGPMFARDDGRVMGKEEFILEARDGLRHDLDLLRRSDDALYGYANRLWKKQLDISLVYGVEIKTHMHENDHVLYLSMGNLPSIRYRTSMLPFAVPVNFRVASAPVLRPVRSDAVEDHKNVENIAVVVGHLSYRTREKADRLRKSLQLRDSYTV